jgi:hypothetical protein
MCPHTPIYVFIILDMFVLMLLYMCVQVDLKEQDEVPTYADVC